MGRSLDLSLLCALALLAAQAPAQSAAPLQGPARCRFAAPEGWPPGGVRWAGACRAGLAQGRGLLRAYAGSTVTLSFYGQLQAGRPVLGVVEQEGGYRAGRFGPDGRVLDDGDRNTLIQAFDEAAAVARQAAQAYRRAGNAASARHYQAKARQLAEQMD